MNAVDQHAAEWACSKVIHRFYRALDGRHYDALTAVMTPDGVWHRQGKRLAGRDAIARALNERPEDTITVHVVSNVIVDLEHDDPDFASASYYVTVRHGHAAGPSANDVKPPPVPAPRAIQLVSDRLMKRPNGWQFVEKSATAIFRSPTPAN